MFQVMFANGTDSDELVAFCLNSLRMTILGEASMNSYLCKLRDLNGKEGTVFFSYFEIRSYFEAKR